MPALPSMPEPLPRTVVLLVFPGFQLLDVSGPAEVFAAVNEQLGNLVLLPYQLRIVSLAGGLVRSSAGLELLSEPLPTSVELQGSTLLVSGGFGVQPAMAQAVLAAWLAQVAPLLARCCSVCTGAFLLAQAGLLDGRAAVTHWRYVALLQQLFPRVRVLADALFVKDQTTYSSAGVTAGIDLCLSLVEEDYGREASLQVAKGLVMYLQRPGGQCQFSAELLAQQAPQGGVLAQLREWLRERLHEPLGIEVLAAAVAQSPRTLHRRCVAELGITPAKFVLQLRLAAACRLLEAGSPMLKRVAEKTGFGSEYNLRRAFIQALQVTPSEYRQRFCRSKKPA